ncbi:MAG: hypothetical protein JWO69_69 [Thermoleophilia bacterium]|jgi:hypothetical protein|nr:hypothetical protein [Thermoleophilia bacterium]
MTTGTMDEATLRRVFPDAPADTAVPTGVGALFGARVSGLRRHVPTMVSVCGLLVAGIALLLAGVIGLAIGAFGAFALLLLILGIVQYGRARRDFYTRYAQARGLTLQEGGEDLPGDVPLLRMGDKRATSHRFEGTIAGQPSTLALYTYTEVGTDSEGNRTTTDYDFTLLRFTLPAAVAARFAGVYLSPNKWSLGKLQDALAHDRKVELESGAFNDRYTLRVVDEQDDIALYELFSPPFIDLLSTSVKVSWQQAGYSLTFWKKGHEGDASDLDRFCLESWHVLQRYLEEHR